MTKFQAFMLAIVNFFLLHTHKKELYRGIHYRLESLSRNLYKRLLHLMNVNKKGKAKCLPIYNVEYRYYFFPYVLS